MPSWGEITGKPTTLAGYGITDGKWNRWRNQCRSGINYQVEYRLWLGKPRWLVPFVLMFPLGIVMLRLNGKYLSIKIDSYLSYRRIEPGYEVWNKIQICQRNLENFSEKVLADNNLTDGSCMNCHIYNQHPEDVSLFHLRGKRGGTILNRNGKLRKLNTKGVNSFAPAVYGAFHLQDALVSSHKTQ